MADLKGDQETWDEDLIRKNFLKSDMNAILKMPLSRSPKKDNLIQFDDQKGQFTVKSSYHLAISLKEENSSSSNSGNGALWKHIWGLRMPNKIKKNFIERVWEWITYCQNVLSLINH